MKPLQFKPLTMDDLILLHRWFQEPGINRMYARSKPWSLEKIIEKYEPRILGKEYVPSFIVYRETSPIGFIQYYSLKDHFPEGIDGHHNALLKKYNQNDLVGIDLFIAEESMRGQGIGVQMIHQFIAEFLIEFPYVLVDPEVKNAQAIHCYEKAGFMRTTYSEDPNYLIMIRTSIPGDSP